MSNRNKYLNNVLKYILEDTLIEIREDGNYINFPFFEGSDKYYSLGNSFLPINFLYRPTSFFEYCRDMYGLTVDEIDDIWEQYRDDIINNTITESINESVDRKDDYLNRVTQFLVEDTKIDYEKKVVYFTFIGNTYPFNSIISLSSIPPVINLFSKYCSDIYGLVGKEIEYVWEEYKNIIFDNIKDINDIEIVWFSEVIDNWGRTKSSSDPKIIKKVLKNYEEWTDDMSFKDKIGNYYYIDDLIGKKIKVGGNTFIVFEGGVMDSNKPINESVDRMSRKDYLEKILQFLVDDTFIDFDRYVWVPPFIYPQHNFSFTSFPSSISFNTYNKDNYGLTKNEIKNLWGLYKTTIKNKLSKYRYVNESVNISDNKRFNDYVINDIIKNTSLEGHHFYLFDCNISVHLNHSRYNPFFEWVPECFYTIMDRHYGLDFDVSNKIWNWYGQYIIDLYLEDFNK